MAPSALKTSNAPTLYLIDGSNYLFRAYHAIRSLTNSLGFPTNALLGFTQMVIKLVEDEAPDYLAVVFDGNQRGFRKELYADYKAHRPPKPPDLIPQIPVARSIMEAFRIPAIEAQGVEADDIIATVATRAAGLDIHTVVVTSDKDLMQLVEPGCVLLDTMKGIRYDAAAVEAKMGVRPKQIVDLLALMGDSSDNIPGVPGIGPKTAATLLAQHSSLDGIYAAIAAGDKRIKGKRLENLIAHEADARISYTLATLVTDAPLPMELADFKRQEPDKQKLGALFGELEFKALQRKYHDGAGPAGEVLDTGHFTVARDDEALRGLAKTIVAAEIAAVSLITTDAHPATAEIVGLSFAVDKTGGYYVPMRHSTLDAGPQPSLADVRAILGPVLADPTVNKTMFNLKAGIQILARAGLPITNVTADPMLMSYLLDAGQYQQTLENLAMTWIDHKKVAYKEIAGTGRKQKRPHDLPVSAVARYACEEALLTWVLNERLAPRVVSEKLDTLYREMEHPLAFVLAEMEGEGVSIDVPLMRRLSHELGERARLLEQQAHAAAGRPFALGSPKQLAEVMFNELGLPPSKKTKTGYSTDSSVLEELSAVHPLPVLVLEWRQVSKLKSTYTDVLPTLVQPRTGRIHTIFNQAVAATGRLSSEQPNLQNIPIRTETGRRIRGAFVARAGADNPILVSADYSQIELRILAHLSGDARMQQAFHDGADIHRRTAAEMLGKDESEVTGDERAMAKTINFGI
ncbi:MAG: DNA polymerase-1, partial [Myxococcota bacterium]